MNGTILSLDDEDITGPFITVGDEIEHETGGTHNSTMMSSEDHEADDSDDLNYGEVEEYDDYDFSAGHLHAVSADLEDASEPRPSNFPNLRRKHSKKRGKRPVSPTRPNSPNRRIKRPRNPNGKRKRIRIKTDQKIEPAVVSQFINDINNNCPFCRKFG